MLGQSARAGRPFALGLVFVIPVFFAGWTLAPSKPMFGVITAGGRLCALALEKGKHTGKEPGRILHGPERQRTSL